MRFGLAGFVVAAHLVGTTLALGAPVPAVDPSAACVRAATVAERRWGLPAHLLEAIGMVESGRRDPDSGQPLPWPWSVNVAGAGYVFGAATAAGAAVGLFQAHGVTSIDVGCFQVNLHYHPDAFASVAEGFNPAANGDYAGRFLRALFQRSGSWEEAIGDYHSADRGLGGAYRARVLRAWRRLDAGMVLPAPSDPHVILATASVAAIPVYTPVTVPASLRAALGLPPLRLTHP
ncbi:MAG: lytic transglycosylase domain-containing protein [Acetobacteraceae bacterium]